MKLVIVTAVEEFHQEIIKLFKKANIENFSESDIDGHKNTASVLVASSWFSGQKSSNESILFFSFTEDKNIEDLFSLVQEFNQNLETNNPIKAVVVPIEKFI
jgi:folylpolyglutamate synthase/dihydropteroate synthase